MNLKTRLVLIPSLLAAGILGACGPEGANEGAGVSTPAAPDVEVVEGPSHGHSENSNLSPPTKDY